MKLKVVLFTVLILGLGHNIYSQTVPQGISYQAVMRDNAGQPLASQAVTVRFSIRQNAPNGVIHWQETHAVTTNQYGLFLANIGQGTSTGSGSLASFSAIDWSTGLYFVEVEGNDGGGFVNLGTSQLLSVPYALHARTVEVDEVDDADNDPTNEIQSLSIIGNDLSISGGNTISLPAGTVYTAGAGIDVTGSVITNTSMNTDNQTLTLTGNDLSITNGNTVTLPGGSVSSVDMVVPSHFTLSGNPITTSGTFNLGWQNVSNNVVLAGPNNFGGQPNFRLLVPNDIPSLDALKITTGTFPLARGGTNASLTAVNGGMVYSTGTAMAITPAGTAGQILQSNGAAAPTWVTAPIGLPTGTSGQTLRHNGAGWVANNTIFNNGTNVGIGTTNPLARLHIEGVSPAMLIRETSPTNGSALVMESDRQYVLLSNESGFFRIEDNTAGLSRFNISPTGNVGIGNTNPQAKLDISGGITYFRPNSGDLNKILVQDNIGSAMRIYTDASVGTSYDLVLGTYPNGHLDQLFLKQSNANVGIGNNNPTQKLHVSGNVMIPSANEYMYEVPKTKYLFIPHVAFETENQNTANFDKGNFAVFGHFSTGASCGYASAPVHLPQGARITEVRYYVMDNNSGGDVCDDLNLTMVRYQPSTGTNSGLVSQFTSLASPAIQQIFQTMNELVDNSQYTYKVTFRGTGSTNTTRLYGVRITYTIANAE
jgi:hypothetical protein